MRLLVREMVAVCVDDCFATRRNNGGTGCVVSGRGSDGGCLAVTTSIYQVRAHAAPAPHAPPHAPNQNRKGSGGQRRCWIPGAEMKI